MISVPFTTDRIHHGWGQSRISLSALRYVQLLYRYCEARDLDHMLPYRVIDDDGNFVEERPRAPADV